jgi:OOP family OmpA-OmpF porin
VLIRRRPQCQAQFAEVVDNRLVPADSKDRIKSGGCCSRGSHRRGKVRLHSRSDDLAGDGVRAESEPVLREIAKALTDHPDWEFDLDCHTDSVGGAGPSLDLSKRRAAAVRQALASRYSNTGTRPTTNSVGALQPKDTNETIEGRARNNRVELTRSQQ